MNKEKEYLLENLSMLVNSGMNLSQVIDSLHTGAVSPKIKKAITEISEDVNNGSPLWKALQKAKFMPRHAVALIKIGEESGRLAENLKVAVIQQRKERSLLSKLRSAMAYPALVLSLALIIGVGVAWFILPRLANVFRELRVDLPILTEWLIAFGGFLGEYGAVVIPVFLATIAVGVYLTFFYSKTRLIGQWIEMRTPVLKRLMVETELSRFGFITGTLLEAGLDLSQALDSLAESTELSLYKKFYGALRAGVEAGNSFERNFKEFPGADKLVPVHIQQMIIAGEKSGSLSNVFMRFGEFFEEKTDITAKNLSTLIEPILLFIVWLGVVFVALAIILPIYSLIGGINP